VSLADGPWWVKRAQSFSLRDLSCCFVTIAQVTARTALNGAMAMAQLS